MGVIGEAAQRENVLTSRRGGGDAGHVPGCARDHVLTEACAEPLVHRDALPLLLRRGYALDEGQVATVLRVADALAAGVSLEARETLGRETHDSFFDHMHFANGERSSAKEDDAWRIAGERVFAIGRASVVPPDADLARVIAAWPLMDSDERRATAIHADRLSRRGWREVARRLFGALCVLEFDLSAPGVRVIGCNIDGEPATAEQWAKLRDAGVPVADGVGV